MKKVIIVGSARKDGDTAKVVSQLAAMTDWAVIDLLDYQISHFDYEHKNKSDDFLDLAKSIVDQYETIIFATPVYWYSMSGILKVFFDRLTDLITIEKDAGRKLRGKSMAAISSSAGGGNLEDDFWLPFQKTAEYLGMHFITGWHSLNNESQDTEIKSFIERVEQIQDKP